MLVAQKVAVFVDDDAAHGRVPRLPRTGIVTRVQENGATVQRRRGPHARVVHHLHHLDLHLPALRGVCVPVIPRHLDP